MPFKWLNVQGLFSVTFKNWDWLWKKYHNSLFLINDREETDSLFWLFLLTVLVRPGWLENKREQASGQCLFFVNSFGARRLIRKQAWTRVRTVPLWHESFLPLLIRRNKDFNWFIKSNSNSFKRRKLNFFHSQTDRLPFSITTFCGHSFFFHGEKRF